jgi:endonuclease YncB( thermonuclease family)
VFGDLGWLSRGTVRPWLAVAAGVLAVVLVGCSSEDDAEPSAPSKGVPSLHAPRASTGDPVVEAEHAALEAYRGMWEAFSMASQVADPEHPDLARYAAGDALEVLVAGLEANRREGLVSDGGEVALYPEVVEVEPADAPAEVRIADCADTSETRRIRPSGPPFSDSPGGWRQVTAAVQLVDEVWKVTDFAVQEVGSCMPEE